MVVVHVQPSVAASSTHCCAGGSGEGRPMESSTIRSHVVCNRDTLRHSAESSCTTWRVVVVLSMYVPPADAVHVPLTERVPVTGAIVQPKPAREMSPMPLTLSSHEAAV